MDTPIRSVAPVVRLIETTEKSLGLHGCIILLGKYMNLGTRKIR